MASIRTAEVELFEMELADWSACGGFERASHYWFSGDI